MVYVTLLLATVVLLVRMGRIVVSLAQPTATIIIYVFMKSPKVADPEASDIQGAMSEEVVEAVVGILE